MEVINWNAIPAWFVGINLLLAGFMWLITRKTRIRLDSRIWGNTFFWIALLYFLSYVDFDNTPTLEERVVGSRLMLCLIALSQWFPLLVSYFRHMNRHKETGDGTHGY